MSRGTDRRRPRRSRERRTIRRRLRLLAALAVLTTLGYGATCDLASTPTTVSQERLEEAVRLRELALAEMENERYESAAAHLESLSEILPDNILPPVNLAICYSRLNRPADALAQVEIARGLDPTNASMLYTLARVLEESGVRDEDWLAVVAEFQRAHPYDVRPYFLQAEAFAEQGLFADAIPVLQRALDEERENLVLLADLLVAAAAAAQLDTALDVVNALEDRLDGFEGSLAAFAGELRSAARSGDAEGARPPALILRNLLRPTDLYQVHLAPLVGGRQIGGGMFPQLDFEPPLPKAVQGGQDISIEFVESPELLSGIAADATIRSTMLIAPSRDGLLGISDGRIWFWASGQRPFAVEGVTAEPADRVLLLALDGDEVADLLVARENGLIEIHLGLDERRFAEPTPILEPREPAHQILSVTPLDVDHDGDLDLFVSRSAAADLYLQNNGDGSWTEARQALGLGNEPIDTGEVVSADFDDDGDLDLVTAHVGSHPRLYLNRRVGALSDASDPWGLSSVEGGGRIRIADFDNDGLFDLVLWGGGPPRLLFNRNPGFESAPLPASAAGPWTAATAADFDNDGDVDLIVGDETSRRLLLLRNRRPGFDAEDIGTVAAGTPRLFTGDLDDDGDLDLVVSGETSGPRVLRNEGGNRNHWLRLVLQGRLDNNSKNNARGLFSRIELRSSGAFQMAPGNGRVNHLGLGAERQAEVLRVIWTNGLAQLWQLVGADRTLVEEQMLKGSCPFLYTWNGDRFEFVTDLMWKSPLGMMLADGSAAPHQSARDWVLIPGEALQPSGGDLWLQVTEELWESVYLDKQILFAIDHPADQEPVIDESFRPPPYPTRMPLHWIDQAIRPAAAFDHEGRDVLPQIADRDGLHVDQLPLSRFQGLTEGHHLELVFDGVPADSESQLVLWGWTFPTDTSINFALAQGASRPLYGPRLELLAADGSWTTISSFIGFPNGKRKAVVFDLGGRLPAGSVTLRVATSMQVYWDAAVLTVGSERPPARVTPLTPAAADLHYRGYSRLYRDSPSGPHLFDYSEVDVTPRFRDQLGVFTRYGDVRELLAAEDDRYVIMNAGDELSVRYRADSLPPLAPGWTRNWVLYTDGWVKDADIHTRFSKTVEPLPYHAQDGYPDPAGHRYPDTPAHRRYLETYQTRTIDDTPFREALRPAAGR